MGTVSFFGFLTFFFAKEKREKRRWKNDGGKYVP